MYNEEELKKAALDEACGIGYMTNLNQRGGAGTQCGTLGNSYGPMPVQENIRQRRVQAQSEAQHLVVLDELAKLMEENPAVVRMMDLLAIVQSW